MAELPTGRHLKESSLSAAHSKWTENTYVGDFTLPKDPKGGVDFKTLGSLLSAKLIEETLYASYVDPVYGRGDADVPEGVQWRFVNTRKGVAVLEQEREGSVCKMMGRTVCNSPVQDIADVLKDNSQRYDYDPMLRSILTLEKISETDAFYYAVFEAKRCLITAQMEFCFYGRMSPVDGNKFVYAVLSMRHPNSPPSKSIPRGKMLYGTGLVVEPYHKDHSKSLVTQITQLDLSGLPRMIMSTVMKEYPMALAGLRSYMGRKNIPSSICVSAQKLQ